MERQVSYNWLPEEGLAIARDEFVEAVLNPRILLLVALPLYSFFVWQAYLFDPNFLTRPLFYVVLLSPLPFYFYDYWHHTRSAMDPENGWGVAGAMVTFAWDMTGFSVTCEDSNFRLDWSRFSSKVETKRFIKLYGHNRQKPMYVFKRPFSDAQLEDFRLCSSVVCPEGAVFL